jgi:HEAT repeat protein
MPKEQLKALAADVDRLLVAGTAVAAADEGLRRRGKALRDLGQKVPVLGQIADAVEHVSGAPPEKATPALLDLLKVVRQVRASLVSAGVEGKLEPVQASGPWSSDLAADDVYTLEEALTRSGSGRMESLQRAVERNAVADLRLVGPYLAALDGYHELADRVAFHALPAFGRSVLEELRRDLNLKGKAVDGRRLHAICRIDLDLGQDLWRKALEEGSAAVRVAAVHCLPVVLSAEEAEQTLRKLADAENNSDSRIRGAALQALRSFSALTNNVQFLLSHATHGKDRGFASSAALSGISEMAAFRKAAVKPLIALLAHKDEQVLLQAVNALGQVGAAANAAVPDLIRVYQTGLKNHTVQLAVLQSLIDIGADTDTTHTVVRDMLSDKSSPVLWEVIKAIRPLGSRVAALLPFFIGLLKEKEDSSQRIALEGLRQAGPAAKAAVPDLLPLLRVEDRELRLAVLSILEVLGPQAQKAVPHLNHIVKGKDEYLSQTAEHTLAAIRGNR